MSQSNKLATPQEISLSLCMIVKNEAYFLDECLRSARPYVDQIVVLDTGSTDASIEIARHLADVVEGFDWVDDFSAARNASLALASGEWILVLDADERISQEDFALIHRTIASTEKDGFYCIQRNYDNNPNMRNWLPVTHPDPLAKQYRGYDANLILRLFRNLPGIRYSGVVHEIVDVSIPELRRGSLQVALHHYIDEDPTKPKVQRQLRYLALLEAALAEKPNGRYCRQAGAVSMYHLKDYARAADYFLQALALGEEPQRSREGAAEAFYRLGETDRALELYAELYLEGYKPPTLCNNYANLLVRTGKPHRAIPVLESMLAAGVTSAERRTRILANIEALKNMPAVS